VKYFKDMLDMLNTNYGYTSKGYIAGCCGSYQATTIDEFKTETAGLVLFTDTQQHDVKGDDEFDVVVINDGELFFHIKLLQRLREERFEKGVDEDDGYGLDRYKLEHHQKEYPYYSIHIATHIGNKNNLVFWQDSKKTKYYGYKQEEIASKIEQMQKGLNDYVALCKSFSGYVCYIYTSEQEEAEKVIDMFDGDSTLVYSSPAFINHNYYMDEDKTQLFFRIYRRN